MVIGTWISNHFSIENFVVCENLKDLIAYHMTFVKIKFSQAFICKL